MVEFVDWGGFLEVLKKAYKAGEFVLIIGPQGCGKTHLVRAFTDLIGADLEEVNFSLRTRESHLVGSLALEGGDTKYKEGVLVRSMRKKNCILSLSEINCAEPDMLVRLNEALDDRRQITLKENGGEVIKAEEGWFVIADINPISFAGTKEMPPQLNSRFPVRIYMSYPSPEVEKKIVAVHTGINNPYVEGICDLAKKIRERAASGEIFYSPSIRESIAFARMIGVGMTPREAARVTFRNIYYQWGEDEARKIGELIDSKFTM